MKTNIIVPCTFSVLNSNPNKTIQQTNAVNEWIEEKIFLQTYKSQHKKKAMDFICHHAVNIVGQSDVNIVDWDFINICHIF